MPSLRDATSSSAVSSVSNARSTRGATSDRLLDAAEQLFAERGFEGASMRALARSARASLSSTNYHFGTKEALLEAVLRRRVGPLNTLRLERLARAREAARGEPIPIDAILDAYIVPLFERSAASREQGALQPWAATRLFFDPAPPVTRIRLELMGSVDADFLAELARALPHRAEQEIEIAFRLTTGLLVHFSAGHVTRGDSVEHDRAVHESAMQGLIAYARAGLERLEATPEKDAAQ